MNLPSWLDFTAGPPWTWRHYLLISAVALVAGAVLVLAAQRRGKREAGPSRLYRALTGNRQKPMVSRK
jgi:hypothetical protein